MGLPICARLSDAGYDVLVSDLRAEREAAALAAGARWIASSRALVAVVDVLITVLPGSQEVDDAVGAVMADLRPNMTWIDMTSCDPTVARDLVARAASRGVDCMEAPMGGGPAAATEGKLQLFVGGDEQLLARHCDLLAPLGRIEHMGANGAGYTTKLLVNLMWFAQAVSVGEALLVARATGIDLERMEAALAHSSVGGEFARHALPALLDGDYLASFGLDRCCEELDAVMRLAEGAGTPREISAVVAQSYRDALARYGPADGELLATALLEERAGLRLRRGT